MTTCERCGLPVTPTYHEPNPHLFPEQCVTALLLYVKDLEWKLGIQRAWIKFHAELQACRDR